jgi:hypothetical protein
MITSYVRHGGFFYCAACKTKTTSCVYHLSVFLCVVGSEITMRSYTCCCGFFLLHNL